LKCKFLAKLLFTLHPAYFSIQYAETSVQPTRPCPRACSHPNLQHQYLQKRTQMKKLLTIALLAATMAGCQNKSQQDQNFSVNDATSKAEWKGSAPDHFHVGSFKVTGGLATDADGIVRSGDFVIPIASIQDFDLKDPIRQALLADLKDNFFKLATHPTAKFHISKVWAYEATNARTDSGPVKGTNYMLTGDFTMLGQTHAISFPAKIIAKGDSLLTEARFDIDRTKWGMNNYNDPKQKLYILPAVHIHLTVQAAINKKSSSSTLAYIGKN
jgi:polyisoprenoid-binding protein YceI